MYNLKRQPTHPGVILKEEFLTPHGLTQVEVAERLKTTYRTVNEIINGKRRDIVNKRGKVGPMTPGG